MFEMKIGFLKIVCVLLFIRQQEIKLFFLKFYVCINIAYVFCAYNSNPTHTVRDIIGFFLSSPIKCKGHLKPMNLNL